MTAKKPRPTDAELAILQILWSEGPSTVREVHEALSAERKTGYTTSLKLMQIMLEKGLVERDDSRRTHIYRAAVEQDSMQKTLVGGLLDRAFNGSAKTLIMQALANHKTSAEELEEIRELLDTLKEDKA